MTPQTSSSPLSPPAGRSIDRSRIPMNAPPAEVSSEVLSVPPAPSSGAFQVQVLLSKPLSLCADRAISTSAPSFGSILVVVQPRGAGGHRSAVQSRTSFLLQVQQGFRGFSCPHDRPLLMLSSIATSHPSMNLPLPRINTRYFHIANKGENPCRTFRFQFTKVLQM